jgi:SARP family transcriptional regulator, regulator of embCAB operon
MPQRVTLTTRKALDLTVAGPPSDCASNCPKIPNNALACISVDLLGGLRVRAGKRTMGSRELGGTKLRRVLLALILHRGAPVSKDRLVSMLWEGTPPSGAKATLETYVCVLRKTLQPCHEVRTSLITTAAGCYAIDMSRVDLDLVRYEQLMSAALQPDLSAIDALPMLREAMTFAESPLLPEELDCEWLDDFRRIHDQQARKDLVAAAHKVTRLPSNDAERWARLALEGDPLDESAWHALLQSMEHSGHHADGLRAYDRCRRLFNTELGCAPGPRLQAVYVRLLRGANEDNSELSQLFDALVKVHAATQTQARPPTETFIGARRDANDQTSSIRQACHTLELLLSSVGSSRRHLTGGIGA